MMTIKKILLKACLASSFQVLSRPSLTSAFVEISFCNTLRVTRHTNIRNMCLILVAKRKDEDSLLDAEDAAAFDAHDLSDPGMEAAAMERAVMMAEEFKINQSNKKIQHDIKQTTTKTRGAGIHEMRTSQDDNLSGALDAAAFDAHDSSDPAMEAAAMERAVMMAEEFKINQSDKNKKQTPKQISSKMKEILLHDVHTDEGDSLLDAEDAAAFDAHDLSDPGMEAAAMERAVMMANELKNRKAKRAE